MRPNCFECEGFNQQCLDERRFVRNEGTDNCFYYHIAKEDLKKYHRGEIKELNLRTMLAEYLMNKGKCKEALGILPST
jgi:hypothetical protein